MWLISDILLLIYGYDVREKRMSVVEEMVEVWVRNSAHDWIVQNTKTIFKNFLKPNCFKNLVTTSAYILNFYHTD
jgi:hypothetical protein